MLFEAKSLSKSYPGVKALKNVDFTLKQGQVHALIGENGAGKSTLARIIGGITQPDSGEMFLSGNRYRPVSVHDGQKLGARMVMQELNTLDTLSIAENIFFEQMDSFCGFINYPGLYQKAEDVMAMVGLGDIDPSVKLGELSIGQKQMVEIASGLSKKCRIFILDEPTSSLTDKEAGLLFARIRMLKQQGVGIIYISHKMQEIKSIADKVTVLRDGELIAAEPIDKVSITDMVSRMVGREFTGQHFEPGQMSKETILRVNNLRRGTRVRGISFGLHKGEILGFAGLIGSGRTETMRCIFGADRFQNGQIILNNRDITSELTSPQATVKNSFALICEDRKTEGLLLSLSLKDNISIGNYKALSRYGFINTKKEKECSERLIDLLKIKCASQRQKANQLSGGNQQKVILARWVQKDSEIFILDEPTRGIDVAARYEIYKLMVELAAKGKSLIVVSSELQELMTVCHRIAVMSDGKLIKIFERNRWSEKEIMAAAFREHVN